MYIIYYIYICLHVCIRTGENMLACMHAHSYGNSHICTV